MKHLIPILLILLFSCTKKDQRTIYGNYSLRLKITNSSNQDISGVLLSYRSDSAKFDTLSNFPVTPKDLVIVFGNNLRGGDLLLYSYVQLDPTPFKMQLSNNGEHLTLIESKATDGTHRAIGIYELP